MERDEDSSACVTAMASIANNEKERKERAKDKYRDTRKVWWEDVCITTGRTKTLRVKLGLTVKHSTLC